MNKNLIIALCFAIVLCAGKTASFGQSNVVKGGLVPEYGDDAQLLWVWGPVVSVDAQRNEFTVKYFDYDTDQEKEMTVTTDEKTSFENIRSLDDIKPADALSIDYVLGPEGKNIARNISVEKPEEPMLPTEEPNEPQLPPQSPKN